MLTALSVARQCGMIKKCDRVILVTAVPTGDENKLPQLQWTYATEDAVKDKSPVSSSTLLSQVDIITSFRVPVVFTLFYNLFC